MGAWRGFVFATATLACACSLLVDTSGLSGGGDGGDGASASDALAADANGDGGSAADAMFDALGVACGDATFCDDFDEETLGAKWGSVEQGAGATLSLEKAGQSAPFALRLDLGDRDAATARFAFLTRDFAMPKTSSCAFSLWIESAPAASMDLGIFTFRPNPASDKYQLEVKLSHTLSVSLHEDFTGSSGPATQAGVLSSKRWYRMQLDTDFRTISVRIDDGAPVARALRGGVVSSMLNVSLGERGDSEQGAFVVRFDDLVCALTP